jgi:Secretion system C-terminal sorting domain
MQKPYSLTRLFFLLIVIFGGRKLHSQVISYSIPAQSITRGLDTTSLTVRVDFPNCNNSTISVVLGATNTPGLIQYIPGTVQKIGGTASLSIIESNISNLASPVFSIGNTTAGEYIEFTIKRRAYCGTAVSSKDNIVVNGTNCSFSETDPNVNSYNLLAPSLSITPPSSITNVIVGSTIVRNTNIINGGNGCLDSLGFWVKYTVGTIQLNTLKIGAITLTPQYSNGDSAYFVLEGNVFGTDGLLCNGESITIEENITVLKCDANTIFGASWQDWSGANCQTYTAQSGMSMLNAVPSLKVTMPIKTYSTCYLDAPRVCTYIITNEGTGPATDIVIGTGQQYNNNPSTYSYGYIDTASIMITLSGGGIPFHPSATMMNSFVLNNMYGAPCNRNQISYLKITLPNTFIIPAGQTVTLTYNLIYCALTPNCNDGIYGSAIGTSVIFKNSCRDASFSSGDHVGSNNFPINSPLITDFQIPSQVLAGSCYDIQLATQSGGMNGTTSNAYVEYELTIPPGVTFNSASLIANASTPHPGFPKVVGNKVITRYGTSASGSIVRFNFCSALGTCGIFPVDAIIKASPDSLCVILPYAKSCNTRDIEFLCPVNCPTGGTVATYWNFERKNYGQPDNNNDKFPDASGVLDQNIVMKHRYRPGDTLHSEYRGYIIPQTSPSNITNWNYLNAYWDFDSHIWVPAGTATVTIKRNPGITVTAQVPIAVIGYGKKFKANFQDVPSAITALIPFLENDSVIVEANFLLKDSLLTTATTNFNETIVDDGTHGVRFPESPDLVKVKHSVRASLASNPLPVQEFTCTEPRYNANVLWLFRFNSLYGYALSGCNQRQQKIIGFTRKLGGYNNRYFPGEYRPESIPDTLEMGIPSGFIVAPNSQYVYGIKNATNANIAPYVAVVGSPATGYKVTFDVKTAMLNNPTWLIASEGQLYEFGIDLKGSCSAPTSVKLTGKETFHYYDWPTSNANILVTDSANTDGFTTYSTLERPIIVPTSPQTFINPSDDTAKWIVNIQNNSPKNAPFSFFKITGNSSFGSIRVKNGATVLLPNANGLFELGNISGSQTIALTVEALTNNCNIDSIRIETGWDCNAYPTGSILTTYTCWKSLYLRALPQQSQIQLTVSKQPTLPNIPLCQTDYVEFEMNSAQANYADNPEFRVNLPVGLSITNAQMEYPLNSGNWQAATATNVGGIYVYSVENHTAIGSNGLPGSINSPSLNDRGVRLRIYFNTACGFISGSKIEVQQRAMRPCGQNVSNALGYNEIVRTDPIIINGAIPQGAAGVTITTTNNVLGCGNTVATINATIVPVGIASLNTDYATIQIPSGLHYNGGFSSVSGAVIAAGYPQAGAGGIEIIKINLPGGITVGNPIAFSFTVTYANLNGCGNYNILTEVVRETPPLSCNAVLCPTGGYAVLGNATNTIVVEKPQLNVINLQEVLGVFIPGNTVQMSVALQNSGTVAAAANTVSVEFFCGVNTIPFTTQVFTKPVGVGLSANDTMTFVLGNIPLCSAGDQIKAVVRPNLNITGTQCLCDSTGMILATLFLPIDFVKFEASKINTTAQLKWEIAQSIPSIQYEIQRSIDAINFTTVGVVNATNNNLYSFTDWQPHLYNKNYYKIKAIDAKGAKKYSDVKLVKFEKNNEIEIYPIPANSNLNIIFSDALINKPLLIALYNTKGQKVFGININKAASKEVLNISELAAGIYYLKIRDGNNFFTERKVIISR